jgi:integrase
VFPNTKGGPDTHIDRVVARLAKRAGVSMVGKSITHSFRKTYATRLKNDAKTPIYKIMKLLGRQRGTRRKSKRERNKSSVSKRQNDCAVRLVRSIGVAATGATTQPSTR